MITFLIHIFYLFDTFSVLHIININIDDNNPSLKLALYKSIRDYKAYINEVTLNY